MRRHPESAFAPVLAAGLAMALAVALGAAPAFATLGPPVKVKLLGAPVAAEAGKTWTGQLEITTALPVQLTNFRVEGAGWTRVRTDAPAVAEMQKAGTLLVDVTATAADPAQPLTFAFDVDGRTYAKTLDLSAANAARALAPELTRVATDEEIARLPARRAQVVPAGPGPSPDATVTAAGGGDAKVTPRDIRVRGRIYYYFESWRVRGADGVTVKVCDDNDVFDATLAVTTTDPDGFFDVTFTWNGCWNCGANPDLFIEYQACNDRVRVEDPTWETLYSWNSAVVPNYGGTDYTFQPMTPPQHIHQAGLHVLTNVTRTWRWLRNNRAYDTPGLDVQWPEGSGAWYNSFFGEMHIGQDRHWDEAVASHEYGHHWMAKFSWDNLPGYCNGVCDGDLLDCGHCLWCPEDQGIAWSEGFPDWMGWLIPNTFIADYGDTAQYPYDFERVKVCTWTSPNYLGDPLLTEGLVAALLQDISDSAQDTQPGFTGGTDALAVGSGPLFICTDLDTPNSVTDFLLKFKNRYAGWAEDIWKTAKNNGYEIDLAPPNPVTGLVSTSHTTGVSSPDPTIDFTWAHPLDDASGVAGYSVLLTTTGAALPPQTQTIGDVTEYTSGTLAPGNWWLNLRAVDRAGRWALVQTTVGPFTIRAAEPSNLAFKPLAGWSSVLVPRGAADATATNVPLPTTLAGDAAATWWNCSLENTGDVATSTTFYVNAWLDGKYAYPWGIGVPLGGHAGLYGNNLGAMTVRAGRHIFEARLDGSDAIPELNENDNRWARQWAWAPPLMTANTTYTRTAPPERYGGAGSVTEGVVHVNCDGVRFSSTGWWNAVAIVPAGGADDYDLYGHAASASALDGFTSFNGGGSARVAGYLDAVIVNRNVMGVQNWDVGVTNYSGGASSYTVRHHGNYAITWGAAPQTVTLGEGEMLRLWEFYIAPGSEGYTTLVASTANPAQPVTVGWLDAAYTVGGLDGAAALLKTGADGKARLDANIAASGYHAMVVYRDPRDGTAPVTITVEVARSKPDLVPVTRPGWAGPLVARPAFDGTVASVAAPDTLIGGAAATWLNLAVQNQGVVEAPAQTLAVDLDGSTLWTLACVAIPPGNTGVQNDPVARTVRGGRHTLALRADINGAVAEASETNNGWGVQYAWSPFTPDWFDPRGREAPPDPTGSWGKVNSGQALYYNSDGLRLAPRTGRWRGVAVMPGEGSDVDLYLHAAMEDPATGFTEHLAFSGWGSQETDFVLVNNPYAGNVAFDVGAVLAEGSQNYVPEAVYGSPITTNETGVYGPYAFAANHLLDLRAINLAAGLWTVRLVSLEGAIDWGLSLYAPDIAHAGKSDVVPGGLAYRNGDGLDESFTVHTTTAGWHCLAIWKANLGELAKSGAYRLVVTQGLSPVPDDTPAAPLVSALVDIRPNPFNPRTRITFDLAAPARARLSVYDLRGALVRRLVEAELPAGRHSAVWDGCDAGGQGAASGVYMAVFETEGARQTRRMVLVR